MAVFLVDTCAVIWIANGDRLRDPAASVLHGSQVERLVVSPISAWEIATLVAKGKNGALHQPRNLVPAFL